MEGSGYVSDIPGAVFKYVEYELYHFQDTKKELEELKKDIANSQVGNISYDDFSSNKTNNHVSMVENTAIDILQNKVAIRASKTISNINNTLKRLDEEKVELFQKKYIDEKPWQQTTKEMNISRATYFRWRKEIVKKTAEEMGLLQ